MIKRTGKRRIVDLYVSLVSAPVRLVSRGQSSLYLAHGHPLAEDGLVVSRTLDHLSDPRFLAAYQSAVKVAGWDYGIRLRTYTLLQAAEIAYRRFGGEGTYLELGTGRGWYMTALLNYLPWTEMSADLFLFDTFESEGIEVNTGARVNVIHPVYAESFEDTERHFVGYPRTHLVRGELPGTLSVLQEDANVVFAHIDLNNAPGETGSLLRLWDKLHPGAVIVWDDYGFPGHHPQRLAVDQLALTMGFQVIALPTGQALGFAP